MLALILVLSGYVLLAYLPGMILSAPRIARQNWLKILIMFLAIEGAHHMLWDIVDLTTLGIHKASAAESTQVKAYTRSNGTYVESHYKSSPDSAFVNNYGSKGNSNPYTGVSGKRSYDAYSKKNRH